MVRKIQGKKITIDNKTFDSQLEASYYKYLKRNNFYFKFHQKFEIIPKFTLGNDTYQARTYTPDFVIYADKFYHKIKMIVDVKGQSEVLPDASLRMCLFSYLYQLPVKIVKFKAGRWTYATKVSGKALKIEKTV